MAHITSLRVQDIRFPTSRGAHGSDAMNPDPDYSCPYVTLETDAGDVGYGITFTIGRGNDICVKAIEALASQIVGQSLDEFAEHSSVFCRRLTGDSQFRWLGPDKGVIHLAAGAIINALWDAEARRTHRPLWQLFAEKSVEEMLRCIDFRYLSDFVTPEMAREHLSEKRQGREERLAELQAHGYPAYTTSAGWLGYNDDQIRQLCREALAEGWSMFKIKVGRDLQDDIRRCRIIREEIGPDGRLMIDANQVWDVPEALAWIPQLAEFQPWFVEEPTSPDDVLGHAVISREIAPLRVATGEHCANKVMFKQFLQAEAMQVCQIDSCRVAGVNEVLAILLLAAQAQVPVCPHAGGVGLCEYVQHLAIIDHLVFSGRCDDRVCEYAAHLHEHFVAPARIHQGRYVVPTTPGYSVQMHAASLASYAWPHGRAWREGQ